MKQILIISGGNTYTSNKDYLHHLRNLSLNYDRLLVHSDWKPTLKDAFPKDDVLLPSMPNKQNAKYNEWKILFEKILPLLFGDFILIGHSLGGIFLAKYLHENTLPQKAQKVILIAPPYDDESGESLGSFKLRSATNVEKSAHEVHIMFSEDDPIVPISEQEKFQKDLPSATFHTFTDRKHFWQEDFPELIDLIKK